MRKSWLLLISLPILFACNTNKDDKPSGQILKRTFTKGHWINPDSVAKPKTVLAGIPKTVLAGKPKVTLTNLNVHIAGSPRVVLAGKPRVITPGTDTFPLPKTVPAIGKTRPAGIPEVVIAKDMASKDINPANFSSFSVLQGLKQSSISCMLADKSGNLWFGTGGGVSRYDGKSFTSFTEKEGLGDNTVFSILQDKSGNLWFGTGGAGVSRYDGKSFTSFTEKEGLANNIVLSIIQDKNGNLWFGTYWGGVSRYDGKSFTSFTEKEGLANNQVNSILEDKSGNLWFCTYGGGVSRYDGKSFTSFTEKDGLANNHVNSILEDKSGNLWFGTINGVSRYDGKFFTTFTEKEGLANNQVLSILQDKSGNLWFGTGGGGVSRYDGKSFASITEKEGLANNRVSSILEDKSGNLWFGAINGVSRYDGKSFTSFTEKEGLGNNQVLSILQEKSGNLWFGTNGGGASRYDGKSFTSFSYKEGLASIQVNSILQDAIGNLWFGTPEGVSRYDGKAFTSFTEKEGLVNNFVTSILQDKSGNLWFGTFGGVSRYDGNRVDAIERGEKVPESDQQELKRENGKLVKSFTSFTEKEGLANNWVQSTLQDKSGNLWFGTNGGGVSRYDGKSFTSFTEKEGLANNSVNSILQDESGNLWFGTYDGGVSRYDGKSFISFTEKEGLVHNNVNSIIQDKSRNLWCGTQKGLSKVSYSNMAKLDEKNDSLSLFKAALFYNYGYNDGFLGLNCARNSVLQDKEGRIWLGANVLTCYTPSGDVIDTTAPVVKLNSIKLFGEEMPWAKLGAVTMDSTGKEFVKGKTRDTTLGNGVLLKDIHFDGITKWYSLPEHLSLPYNNNNLTFSFIGIHIQSHNHIKYQFKLEGMDPDWSSITDRTEAPYGNLPSGDYTFKVKAMNQSGVWSEPTEFRFVVRPPWWQTWWFRTLVFALIVGAFWFYIKWRERNFKREKELLEKKVEVRTHQLNEQKEIADSRRIIAEEQRGVITKQKELVEKQKTEVDKQKHIIEEKHKEITDSINYAERIQRSFLATKELLDSNLNEYFVFFQPKDVVSGDFYWASLLSNGNFALATADSTGHGVPGAIMSILNISCLENAVGEMKLVEPGEIVNHTRLKIIERLKKDGSPEGGKDGMDCSLICFDFKQDKLTYAAANNPVWIVRGKEILEFAPDKMPVGKHDRDSVSFTQHTLDLLKGDVVYAITDGMPDQFGGPKGKKYMYKQLKELLISIASQPMQEQKVVLASSLNTWKGNLEQIDDVTIVGVRI
jgi:ligand-binding sensor domain-containing protein/serine phosphatase RsbU (regulator of sigma subunit)